MTKEALRLALEALENAEYGDYDKKELNKAITAIKEALANEALDKMAENARELGLDYEPAQPFITHNVEQPYDWSEWVCPDPKGYLMKCCDCGLVHEAQFGVVRYKSETEREDCDMVDDPNLQAVFRMRRSEQWSPEDTAHRSGGLPMAQPEQEPVAWVDLLKEAQQIVESKVLWKRFIDGTPLSNDIACWMAAFAQQHTTPPQLTWVGLTDEELSQIEGTHIGRSFARAIESKLRSKNS